MKTFWLIRIISVLLLAVSCQKGPETAPVNAGLDVNAVACQPGSNGVSVADSKVIGVDRIVADQKTSLALENTVNCGQAEKAKWSVGNSPLGEGNKVQATIKGTGVYYLKVDAPYDPSIPSTKAEVNKATITQTSVNLTRVAVTDSKVILTGSQIGVEFNSYTFSLVVPAGVTLKTADWDFGGGSAIRHSLISESKSFSVGVKTFTVVVTDTNDNVTTLHHTITILPITAGIDCSADQLATIEITGPTQVPISTAFNYALNQPACIQNAITKLNWNFGDASAIVSTSDVSHTYAKVGDYKIVLGIWVNSTAVNPTFTVTRDVNVVDLMDQNPGPGTPPNPMACVTAGSTRTSDATTTTTKDVACGLNGKRTNIYRDQIIEVCQMNAGELTWSEQSRNLILVTEGPCQGQSCSLADQVIADGQSIVAYRNQTPANACALIQETRICTNGLLSGSEASKYLNCQSGCGDFGVSGTVKTAEVVGSISQQLTCPFAEAGIYDVYYQVADKTCSNGTINTANTRQGDLKEKGSCPVYKWVATDQYTTCSADCGGQQKRVFSCRDNNNIDSDFTRCGGGNSAPVEERDCDGNPNAVRQTNTTVVSEEANSSTTCPKNQIGVIVNDRLVTTAVTMACIDHQIQEESRTITASPWVATSYCRNFTPMRCSQDSLSNANAAGRYGWMVKCQNQIPVIKEFLENFDDVVYKGFTIDDDSRHLYPTFMDSNTKKTWVAPKVASATCTVPTTVYVAAVCLSSCSTPEQEVIAEVENRRKLRRVPFVEALTKRLTNVGTFHESSTLRTMGLVRTEVDNWVTELVDTTQPVITFKMQSGGHIRVTPNHPLLNKEGSMQLAREFKVNDNLVQLGGALDKIVSIQTTDYYGKVYNLFVKSSELKRNIVVINGYLSGTAFYQNEGAKYMNRQILRKNLTRGVFDQ